MITSTKPMLTMFWDIHSVIFMNWLPQGMFFNRGHFNEYILQPVVVELDGEEKVK
jgi:hypothetical protein